MAFRTIRPDDSGYRSLAFQARGGNAASGRIDAAEGAVPAPEVKLLGLPGFGFSLIAVLADGLEAHLGADHT